MKKEKLMLFLLSLCYAAIGSAGVYMCAKPLLLGFSEEYAQYITALYVIVPLLFLYDLMKSKYAAGSFVVLGIVISYPFLIRKTPDDAGFSMAALYLLALVMMKRIGNVKVRLKAGALALAAGAVMLGGGLLLKPFIDKQFEHKMEIREAIQGGFRDVSLEKLFWPEGNGGVSDGNLKDVSEFTGGGETQLRIRTGEPQKLYIQGFIGEAYKKNTWKQANEWSFLEWSQKNGISKTEVRNQLYDSVKPLSSAEDYLIEVENVSANSRYKYMPYGARYSRQDTIAADTFARGGRKDWQTAYIGGISYEQIYEWNETGKTDVYGEYVRGTYLLVPEHIKKAFGKAVKEESGQSVEDAVEEVKNLLRRETSYNLSPGKAPSGKDFAEHFFFDSRKGFCMHYATTAVLMLRMKGIPARFVSGYLIDEGAFESDEEYGYIAEVTGDDAHAWAEIYKTGTGWVPVEVTPPYYRGETAEADSSSLRTPDEEEDGEPDEGSGEELEEEDRKEISRDTSGEEREKQKEEPESASRGGSSMPSEVKKTAKAGKLPVGRLLRILTAAGAGFGMVVLQSILRRRKKLGYGLLSSRKKARRMFASLYSLLVFSGMQEIHGFLEDQFAEEAAKVSRDISRETWEKILSIALEANYGRGSMSKEEYLLLKKAYIKLRRQSLEKRSLLQKIYLKYGRAF